MAEIKAIKILTLPVYDVAASIGGTGSATGGITSVSKSEMLPSQKLSKKKSSPPPLTSPFEQDSVLIMWSIKGPIPCLLSLSIHHIQNI